MTEEYIKELLKKYFDAEATLEEEALIRGYFTGGDIDTEFEPYLALFRSLSKEREEYLLACGVDNTSFGACEETEVTENCNNILGRRTGVRRRYYLVSVAAAAAVFVLGLFAVIKDRSNPVLIINGEKIYNTELAIAMAGESLDNMNIVMEKIQNNRAHLEKIGKIGEIMSSLEELNRSLTQNDDVGRLIK